MTKPRIPFMALAIAASALVPAFAQDGTIRAKVTGEGGDGKCTFEVEVEGVAEVEIRGAEGYLRTVSGLPARWRRLDCNQALPQNPASFQFKGIDGRGSQKLVRDPGSNGGVAVIQIEDSKNGSDGYTGDITWHGSAAPPVGAFGGNSAGAFGPSSSGVWAGQGWGSGWGDTLSFTSQGNGNFDRNGGPRYDLRGASINIDRSTGSVNAAFDTERGPGTLSFVGKVNRINSDTIDADILSGIDRSSSAIARGRMRILVNSDRSIHSIDMDGDVDNSSFHLNWRNR